MLMNLGSLVTITAAAPANLTLILADNGVYEVTGAQPTAGSAPGARTERAWTSRRWRAHRGFIRSFILRSSQSGRESWSACSM